MDFFPLIKSATAQVSQEKDMAGDDSAKSLISVSFFDRAASSKEEDWN